MTSRTPGISARAAWSAIAVASLAVGSFGFALPATAVADTPITENGGATRNQEEDRTDAIREALDDSGAKNVILLIGDGMGDSEITVARNYAEGAGGTLPGIDALPLTGQYVHWAVDEDGNPNYASESASTASAWSTGTKTVNGKLSVDYQNTPQSTLLEIAKANGMKTGNVSTSEIQDATPGAEIAHISLRGCYGPVKTTRDCNAESVEEGGLGSISEQLLNVRPDVTLGGGSASFTEVAQAGPWAGQTLFEQAEDRGYQSISTKDELAAVTEADANKPLLGLFHPSNLPVRYAESTQTVITDQQIIDAQAADTDVPLPEPERCEPNADRPATQPTLSDMTSKAIDLLDGDDGFFLQVEGASIDKQDHAANACGQIGETIDLDEAVQVALAFAKEQGDTLVVVTADHAHTSQIVGSPIPGINTNLLTEEGQPLIVAYGTNVAGESQQHTGAQVRIAGYGPGAANVIGLTDQTDLFFTSANTLGLERDLQKLSSDATLAAPTEVAPGQEFTATVSGLDADWQATATFGSESSEPGQVDVLNGTADFTFTAPDEIGTNTVTVTGAQTDVAVTVEVEVTASPVPSASPSPSPSPSSTGAAAGVGNDSAAGALAITGSTGPWALAGIAGAMLALGAYVVHRRRRGLV